MSQAETCPECKRPKYTADDLERWHREYPDDAPPKDPPWAATLCWTKAGVHCNCRPIETTPSATA